MIVQLRELYAKSPHSSDFLALAFKSVSALNPEEYKQFKASPEYHEIMGMLHILRATDRQKKRNQDDGAVIMVRLPKEAHLALLEQAKSYNTTLNKLCVDRLL